MGEEWSPMVEATFRDTSNYSTTTDKIELTVLPPENPLVKARLSYRVRLALCSFHSFRRTLLGG